MIYSRNRNPVEEAYLTADMLKCLVKILCRVLEKKKHEQTQNKVRPILTLHILASSILIVF